MRYHRFPLIAILHLTTVATLLCACLAPPNFDRLADQAEPVAIAAVLALLFGAATGVCVGLMAARRLPACLLGAPIGAAAALLVLGVIASGRPLHLLIASLVAVLAPMLVRIGHP